MSRLWPSLEDWTLIWELGDRAAVHVQRLPRDMRWFRGLYR